MEQRIVCEVSARTENWNAGLLLEMSASQRKMDRIRPFLEIKKAAGEIMVATKPKTTSERDATLGNVIEFLY